MNNPSDEMLDIVDENDNVVGQELRSVARANKMLFREVAVLIYDTRGRVFTQQRGRNKSHQYEWIISVAGHVTAGMDPQDAAYKELGEELGIQTKLEFVRKNLDRHYFYLYKGLVEPDTKIILDPQESEQGKFVTEQELEAMIAGGEIIEQQSLADFRSFWAGQL